MNSNSTITTSFLNQNWSAAINPSLEEISPATIKLEPCFPNKQNGRYDIASHCRTPNGVNILTAKELLSDPAAFLAIMRQARGKETITILCTGTTFIGDDGLKAIFFLQYTPGSLTVHFGYIGKKRNCRLKNVYRMIQAA